MRYTIKYPRTPWTAVSCTRWWRSRARAEQYVERTYSPGYSLEPYVQLVEVTRDGMRVAAEWDVARREWVEAPLYEVEIPVEKESYQPVGGDA